MKDYITGLLVCFAIVVAVGVLTACSTLQPPERYLPGQQYGDGGATPCMNGVCPVVNQPKQWLKPCN